MPTSSEQTPLLSGGDDDCKKSKSFLQRQRHHLKQNISTEWADIVLILLFFDTGLIDGSATSTWGSFVSMQTGNTIYVGLGVADPSTSNRWIKALISVFFFMFGSMCFGAYHRWGSPSQRWVQTSSFMIQSFCIIGTATMVTVGIIDGESLHWSNVLGIGLLSFQSAGQAVASQAMSFSELPTVVLTSVYRDLMSDPNLFAWKPSANPKRNRRVLAILMLFAGAAVSRVLGMSPVGLAGSLWLSAAMKATVGITWYLWAAEKESE